MGHVTPADVSRPRPVRVNIPSPSDQLMNPREFLDLANDLAVGSTEAEWRTSVSRAYYAAFHAASKLMIRCGFGVPQAEQAHGYLWLRLCNSGHLDVAKAGR